MKDLVLSHFESEQEPLDIYSISCLLRFAESLSGEEQKTVLSKLRFLAPWANEQNVELSESSVFVTSPESPLYEVVHELVDFYLVHDLDTQSPDGSWSPNWEWGMYPEEWQIAKVQWQGILTLQRLVQFKNFDRIESI
jgi:hypothetical protein